MRILLTGNKGFIGSYIQEALQHNEHEVLTLDVATDIATWRGAFVTLNPEDIDLVIHAGAISDSRATGRHLWLMNYETTKELSEWVLYRNTRLLFLSSCTAIDPQTDYGWTKRVSEDILTMTIPPRNISLFRLYNVWDLHEPQEKANRSIISKLITGDLPHIYRDCIRNFIHVTDVVTAVLRQTEQWQPGVHEIRTAKFTLIEWLVDKIYAHITDPIPKPTVIDCPVATDTPTYGTMLPDWEAQICVTDKTKPIAAALRQHYTMRGVPEDDPEYASMLERRQKGSAQ